MLCMDIFESAYIFNALYYSLENSDYSIEHIPNSHLCFPPYTHGKNEVYSCETGFHTAFGIFSIYPTQLLVNDFHLTPSLAKLISCKHSCLISQGKHTKNPHSLYLA